MNRVVQPEILDSLRPEDPVAMVTRRDLRLINRLLGNGTILEQVLRERLSPIGANGVWRVAELGAGDGQLALRVARSLAREMHSAIKRNGSRSPSTICDFTLVDLNARLEEETSRGFASLDWRARMVNADVFSWLSDPATPSQRVVICNLFLHHFAAKELEELLRLIAAKTQLLVAVEPRRRRAALLFCRLMFLLGCHRVTRHDAVISVRAGFAGQELTEAWKTPGSWTLREWDANPATHVFVAEKRDFA